MHAVRQESDEEVEIGMTWHVHCFVYDLCFVRKVVWVLGLVVQNLYRYTYMIRSGFQYNTDCYCIRHKLTAGMTKYKV